MEGFTLKVAYTSIVNDQIKKSIIKNITPTIGRGEFVTLARESSPGNLIVLDFPRVTIPRFRRFFNKRWNVDPVSITNSSSFLEICTHLVTLSADDEPLLVMPLPRYEILFPGSTLYLPEESVSIPEFRELLNSINSSARSNRQKFQIFDFTVLPYRAVASTASMRLTGSAESSELTINESANSSTLLSSIVNGIVKLDASADVSIALTSASNAFFPPIETSASANINSLSSAEATVPRVNASASGFTTLSGESEGTNILTGLIIDEYDWYWGVDFSTLSDDPIGTNYSVGSVISPYFHSDQDVLDEFNLNPEIVSFNGFVLSNNNISTNPFTSDAIDSARIDRSVTLDYANLPIIEQTGRSEFFSFPEIVPSSLWLRVIGKVSQGSGAINLRIGEMNEFSSFDKPIFDITFRNNGDSIIGNNVLRGIGLYPIRTYSITTPITEFNNGWFIYDCNFQRDFSFDTYRSFMNSAATFTSDPLLLPVNSNNSREYNIINGCRILGDIKGAQILWIGLSLGNLLESEHNNDINNSGFIP